MLLTIFQLDSIPNEYPRFAQKLSCQKFPNSIVGLILGLPTCCKPLQILMQLRPYIQGTRSSPSMK